jgi:excisionase family DNA binding protein
MEEAKRMIIEPDLTTDEVAAALRLHRVTVQRLLKTGRLRGYQVGRSWRVPREALEEFRHGTLQSAGRFGASAAASMPWGSLVEDAQWERALLDEKDLASVPPVPAEALRRESLYEE